MSERFRGTTAGRQVAKAVGGVLVVLTIMGCGSPWWEVPSPPATGYYLDGGPGPANIDFLDENGHWQHLREEPLPWIMPIAGFSIAGAGVWAQLPTDTVGTLSARIYLSGDEVATQARADSNCIVDLWYP